MKVPVGKFMNDIAIAATMLLSVSSFAAQTGTKVIENSKRVDVRVTVDECSMNQVTKCPAKFAFYRVDATKPFQVITVDTAFAAEDAAHDVIFGDFNFDGLEDVAISDGMDGGYITPSYQIFILSRTTNRYVHHEELSKLSQGPSMGLFDVDKRKRLLYTRWREGCCYFIKEGFDIINGKPRKVVKVIVDESSADRQWDVITTSKLVKGRWKTWTKRVRVASCCVHMI